MDREDYRIQRIHSAGLVVERLPDGSTAVFDTRTRTVHALNVSAAAAFEACGDLHTVPALARAMGESLKTPISHEVAMVAISQLEAAGLVVCCGPEETAGRVASRRSILQTLGAAAGGILPAVLSLTAAEQKAFADFHGYVV